jgi:hypothetical protein
MQYHISPSTSRSATYPHSWFILNLIIVHLFAFLIILEIGTAMSILMIPLVSMVILALLWRVAQRKQQAEDWFVAAHWLQMTKRSKMLLIFYGVGFALGVFTYLMVGMSPLKGDNVTTIALRMGAVPIFLGVLTTFVLSGGSIFDAQRGMIGDKLVQNFPPNESWLAQNPITHTDANAVKAHSL